MPSLFGISGDIRRGADDNLYVATPGAKNKLYRLVNLSGSPGIDSSAMLANPGNQVSTLTGSLPMQPYRIAPAAKGEYKRHVGLKQYEVTDHLGNVRAIVNDSRLGSFENNSLQSHADVMVYNNYYPFGSLMPGRQFNAGSYRYGHNAQESDPEISGSWGTHYTAEFWMYDSRINRRWNVDPIDKEWESSYAAFGNNPIMYVDPNGLDWYDINGSITWHDNEGDLTIDDNTYQSLGRNVLVGTHNRDMKGNEEINTARFDLYLEDNKLGSSATIYGNTVPADVTRFGVLAEGLYSARSQGRASKGEDDLAIIINEGKELPTVFGNPNKVNSDMLTAVFFHAGNYGKERLTYTRKDGSTGYISKGCQTSGCGQGSRPLHNTFMGKVGRDFNGYYYLRGRPQSKPTFQVPSYTTPIDNTFVAPIYRKTF